MKSAAIAEEDRPGLWVVYHGHRILARYDNATDHVTGIKLDWEKLAEEACTRSFFSREDEGGIRERSNHPAEVDGTTVVTVKSPQGEVRRYVVKLRFLPSFIVDRTRPL